MQSRLRIGTRGSPLALIQTRLFVAELARAQGWTQANADARTEIVPIKTTGDKIQDRPLADIGGKGLFAKEIEEALLAGTIDCAVHSLKDMPALLPPGLVMACHLQRGDPRDAFVSTTAATLADLPKGAVVGTSSPRRQAMVLNARPDLKISSLRGNVDTRLKKIAAGDAHATVLALAGLKRLGAEAHARHIFSTDEMLPAVAQGTIGIEVREDDARVRALLAPSNYTDTDLAVTLERAFLAALGGSCKTPIAGLAQRRDASAFHFTGCVLTPDGRTRVDVTRTAPISSTDDATRIGLDAGRELLARAGSGFFDV